MRQVILLPDGLGGFVAEVPSLPDCRSKGKTYTEVLGNLRQAITAHIETLQAQGQPLPEPTFIDVPKREGVIVYNMLTQEDVVQAAQETFSRDDLQTGLKLLNNYSQGIGREQVQMAIIGLSKGSLDKMQTCIARAERDYRDLLIWYSKEFGKYP